MAFLYLPITIDCRYGLLFAASLQNKDMRIEHLGCACVRPFASRVWSYVVLARFYICVLVVELPGELSIVCRLIAKTLKLIQSQGHQCIPNHI